jgi:hypothetical protein
MTQAVELLKQGKRKELWQMCCGFIDLSMEQFMGIQKRLLLEQMELLRGSELGRKMMGGIEPSSFDEFRERIPLTTYADYAPYLQEQNEDILPEKPLLWMNCVGKSGEYKYKWVPVTERVYQEAGKLIFAAAVFATCNKRGEIDLKEEDKFLHALAPPPFATGMMAHMVEDVFGFALIPSLGPSERMRFASKMQLGFDIALSEGLDLLGAMTSVLVKIGEQYSDNLNNNIMSLLSNPKRLPRIIKGLIRSKLAGRPMLPKDIWSVKGILGGGTDTAIYRERAKELWGKYPLDVYGCTENIIIAMQTWDYEGMTFNPYLSLLEFMSPADYYMWQANPNYRPKLLTLDEVEPDQNYILVITSFHGVPFVRYIIGDMIKITKLRNENLDIDIPQMVFEKRADGLLDIAGFARLTEKTVGQAIDNAGITYEDWRVEKEAKETPVLHIYLTPRNGTNGMDEKELARVIHAQLRELDTDYANVETLLGLKPLVVTLLPRNGAPAKIHSEKQVAISL